MPFRPCPSGCGRFLSADDVHDRCLQCLGRRHAEAAFVDDSCVCCGRMSMISLRSRLSFMKGLAPSAATRADPGSSVRMPQNTPPSVPSTPTPFRCTTTGTSIVRWSRLHSDWRRGSRCPACNPPSKRRRYVPMPQSWTIAGCQGLVSAPQRKT